MTMTNEELEKEQVKLTAMLLEVSRRNYHLRQAIQIQAEILESLCHQLTRPIVPKKYHDLWTRQLSDVAEMVRKASTISD